jgi:hypothetical protein
MRYHERLLAVCMAAWLHAVWLYACMGVWKMHVHGALWARSVFPTVLFSRLCQFVFGIWHGEYHTWA